MPSPAHIFDPILFFLCQKEKNGFNLPGKESGQGAYRCPEFDSENLGLYLSVAPDSTTRKVSALCASPFGGAASQNRSKAFPFGEGAERSEADEGRGAKTMHCAVGRVLHTLIRPFGPPSPRRRPSAARGSGPMSTRKGQAASVTLLRREQLRSASAPTGCGVFNSRQRGG